MNGEYKVVCRRRKQPLEGYAKEVSPQNISQNMVNMVVWTIIQPQSTVVPNR
jgi:hypothetical protein